MNANARNYFLALLTGLCLVVIYPGWNWYWLAPLTLAPLVFAVASEWRAKHRFLLGYFAGFIHSLGVYYWFAPVLAVHGGMGEWGGFGTLLVYCFIRSIHYGLFSLFAAVLIPSRAAVLLIPCLWTFMEWSQQPTTDFTWLLLGNPGIDMGMLPLRLVPWVGVYGLSFLFAMTGSVIALTALRRPVNAAAPIIALILLAFLPAIPKPAIPTESAVTVQPNIDPETTKWTWESVQGLEQRLAGLSLESALMRGEGKPVMVLWPELPAPVYYEQDAIFREHVTRVAKQSGVPVVLGTVVHDPKGDPLNSAEFIDREGKIMGRYDKMHLVPFGEYVPSIFSWVNKVSAEAGTFAAGKAISDFAVNGHRVGVFICYESALPGHVREFVAQGDEVLVMLTNDGYFFRTSAREQHLQLARMRAVENNRWLLRVTNNGHTVAIDPTGHIAKRIPEFVETSARLPFSWIQQTTFYSRHGDWFIWICSGLPLLAGLKRGFSASSNRGS